MSLKLQNAELLISAGEIRQFPSDPVPQVVFSGRSNVGKSTLINSLLGRKNLARCSSAPGKTITLNFYRVDKQLMLVDLPGYGFAKRSPDAKERLSVLTDGFFTQNKNLDRVKLILQLIDMKVGPTADDEMMLDFLHRTGLPFAVVASKADKLNKTEFNAQLTDLKNHPLIGNDCEVIPFSSLSGLGKNEIWTLICAKTGVKL